jgi:hypothetical protein
MKPICRVFVSVISLVAVAALAAHALSGHGSFSGRAIITPQTNGIVTVEVAGSGSVSHLGMSSLQLRSVVDLTGPTPAPVLSTIGVVTTAHRETISFTLHWSVMQEASPGVFQIEGPFTVTGGTGSFSGATGSGTWQGTVDLNRLTSSADFSATISR